MTKPDIYVRDARLKWHTQPENCALGARRLLIAPASASAVNGKHTKASVDVNKKVVETNPGIKKN
jgi:hypothetical protein